MYVHVKLEFTQTIFMYICTWLYQYFVASSAQLSCNNITSTKYYYLLLLLCAARCVNDWLIIYCIASSLVVMVFLVYGASAGSVIRL